MTQQEQLDIVKFILDTTFEDIKNQIESGKIPEDWNGIELRQYLPDYITGKYVSYGKLIGKRAKEYKNTILINNLI